MHRINSVNARANQNGTGKAGFHDNADLAGQDATYLTPTWCNTIQEEIANLLEKNGAELDISINDQLYHLLATHADLLALAQEMDNKLQNNASNTNTTIQNLLDLLNSLQESLKNVYPKIIASGVATGNSTIDLTSQVDDLRDDKYSIQITPESMHEAWELTRNQKSFDLNIWNRSGTNRIDYSGNISWSVILVSANDLGGGNGDFSAGNYTIPVLANETKKIILVGAGGGGGLGVHQDDQEKIGVNGTEGEHTQLLLNNEVIASANGGSGGQHGWWDNGSAWVRGESGAGGITSSTSSVSVIESRNGKTPITERHNHLGADSVSSISNWGAGGNGGNGYGNDDDGWAGGGGSGAMLICTFTNNTNETTNLTLKVGMGGKEGNFDSYTTIGTKGLDGVARVLTI